MGVVIIGAAGGIGSALARSLKHSGRNVFLAGRSEQPLAELASELDAPFRVAEASDDASVRACLADAVEMFDSVAGVVNAAGSILLKPAHRTKMDEWDETIRQNLTSAFVTVKEAIPVLKANGGSIVLFSSAAARHGLKNHEAIAAAKAGVIGLTKSAAATYAGANVRVNAIAPGLVRSNMSRRVWNHAPSLEYSQSIHALGRIGEPEDVAGLAAWLLDPTNTWTTGQVFGVDGGLAGVRAG